MTRQEAERAVVEYLVDTGFIGDKASEVASLILAGQPLSVGQQAVFQREIADAWFHVECEKCYQPIPIEAIPVAIESGDALCEQCRHGAHEADAFIEVSAQ